MIEEGFSEEDVITAILGESKIIEIYDEDKRCLILGYFLWNDKIKSPIHMVCDYSNRKLLDQQVCIPIASYHKSESVVT